MNQTHTSLQGRRFSNRVDGSRATAESMLRDMAFVLQLTARTKAEILADQTCRATDRR